MNLANRLDSVSGSGTLASMDALQRLRRQGIDVFTFSDRLPPPQVAVLAAKRALDEAWSSFYTPTAGLPLLRQILAERASRGFRRNVDPASEVLVTVGGKEAVVSCVLAMIDVGNEVLIPDPAWVSYEPCVRLAGGSVVRVPLSTSSQGFRLDVLALEKAITRRTKMLILNSPHNPTGMVLNEVELEGVAGLAQGYDLIVMADESYEHFVFDGARHISIASMPGMFGRTVTVSTSSKIFNMFGWRVGWAIGPSELMEGMLRVHQNLVGCAPSFSQAGVAAALSAGASLIDPVVAVFAEARDVLIAELNAVAGVHCHWPQGAYFAFPSIRDLARSDREVAHLLLNEAHVHTISGSTFGPAGEGFLRLTFSCTAAHAREGAVRMAACLRQLAA